MPPMPPIPPAPQPTPPTVAHFHVGLFLTDASTYLCIFANASVLNTKNTVFHLFINDYLAKSMHGHHADLDTA